MYTSEYINANILNNLMKVFVTMQPPLGCVCMCVCVCVCAHLYLCNGRSTSKGATLIATGGGQSSTGRSVWVGSEGGGLCLWLVCPVREVGVLI